MPSSSPHVNMSFFSYDGKKTISAADAGQRTLSDWNRHIEADQTGRYFINGIKLSELRATMLKEGKCQQLVFADLAELKQFFKEYLFKDLSAERADLAAIHASLQWHQSGIQHATYQHTRAYALEYFPTVQIPEPEYHIHFVSTQEGVCITESNIYRELVEVLADKTIQKHTGDEKKGYCAQTSTTYLFTPENIQLEGIAIDCPNLRLAEVFDIQPEEDIITYLTNIFFRALYAFIARFYSGYAQLPTAEQEDSQTNFEHPRLT
ncbi:MAG: hypothetical protein KBB94_10600 [Legionellaceae bacterium]|nr:hypothetical protein [Legionellaceae bacterium]